jgi:Protein of unknown function (DUF1428)
MSAALGGLRMEDRLGGGGCIGGMHVARPRVILSRTIEVLRHDLRRDGFVAAVPTANREKFKKHAEEAAAALRENGALSVVECWGDDVPEGQTTSLLTKLSLRYPFQLERVPWLVLVTRNYTRYCSPELVVQPADAACLRSRVRGDDTC